jgi:hypothetical protein
MIINLIQLKNIPRNYGNEATISKNIKDAVEAKLHNQQEERSSENKAINSMKVFFNQILDGTAKILKIILQ